MHTYTWQRVIQLCFQTLKEEKQPSCFLFCYFTFSELNTLLLVLLLLSYQTKRGDIINAQFHSAYFKQTRGFLLTVMTYMLVSLNKESLVTTVSRTHARTHTSCTPTALTREDREIFYYCILSPPEGSGPILEVLQYQANPGGAGASPCVSSQFQKSV